MLYNRHLVLRGNAASSVMKVRASVELAFVQAFDKMSFTKVSLPALVQGQVEGGATLFKVPYYQEHAYLTQSSQLYLKTVLPSLGNVFCIEKSFRAEKSFSTYSSVENRFSGGVRRLGTSLLNIVLYSYQLSLNR